MAISTDPQGALEVRRQSIARVEQIQGGVFTADFFVDVTGAGEALAQVEFDVRFVERPMICTGWDMTSGTTAQRLQTGSYPTADAGVVSWKYGKAADTGVLYYDGATVAIVTTGRNDLFVSVHLSFRGKAVYNPGGR